MKIAFVTLGFTPIHSSGLDVSGDRLVIELLKAGHEITVIAGKRGAIKESLVHPALSIHRVPIGITDWLGFSYDAARLLKTLNHSNSFDIVHFWDIHFAYAYSDRFLGSLHQSFRQRIYSLDWRNDSPVSLLGRFVYYTFARFLLENPSIKRASGLLAISSATGNEFIKHYRVSPDRISIARHGIDTEFFRRIDDADLLRSKLGIAPYEHVILFAGFITPRKGLKYLATAFPLIHPKPRLIIVGQWKSTAYREEVLHLFGSAKTQVIETGFVPDAQMPEYYSLADLYVSPSLLEGFGLPLAESLACETPAVTTNAGAAAEVVGPGGLLVTPGDSYALANAVSSLLNDPLKRSELGKKGREYIEKNFSLRSMLRSTLEAYEKFIFKK
jgi:glycosyltransferase involved in cell wall biosynthesis